MPSYTLSYDDAQERRQGLLSPNEATSHLNRNSLPAPQGPRTAQNLAGTVPPLGPLTKTSNQITPKPDLLGPQGKGLLSPPGLAKTPPPLGAGLSQATVKKTIPMRGLPNPGGALNVYGENISQIKNPYEQNGVTIVPWDDEAFLAKRLLPQQQYLDYSAQQPKYDEYGDVIPDTGGVRINQALNPELINLDQQQLGLQQAALNLRSQTADNGRFKQYEKAGEDIAGNPFKMPGGLFDTRTGQVINPEALAQPVNALPAPKQPIGDISSFSKKQQQAITDAYLSDDPRKRSIAEKYFGKL